MSAAPRGDDILPGRHSWWRMKCDEASASALMLSCRAAQLEIKTVFLRAKKRSVWRIDLASSLWWLQCAAQKVEGNM